MKKVLFFILVFSMIMVPFVVSGETIMDIDGKDWGGFTEEQKTFIVMGVMLSSAMNFEAADTLNASGDLTPKGTKVLSDLNNLDVQVGYVIDKVSEWYNETRDWETNLYYVIFGSIGNFDSLIKIIEELENADSLKKEL